MDHAQKLLEQAGEGGAAPVAHEQHSGMQSVQNLEAVINEGLRVSLLAETPDQSLAVLLEHLGKALNGARTYIFEQNEAGCDDNTYEWVTDGVEPEKDNLQNVPPEVCATWYRNFRVGRHIVIECLEDIRDSDPLQYANLKRQGIHSLVVVPLYDGKQIIGFYGVDNPPVKLLEYASNMLQTAAYFIVSSLKRRNLFRELQKRSHKVLHALSVDYLCIYQVDLDTGACEAYRECERMSTIRFAENYQASMEQYILHWVIPRDQVRLLTVTARDYVLAQLQKQQKFSVRFQMNDNPSGFKHMELHFSATEQTQTEHSVIFALRDVNAVVEQEEKYKLEARQSMEDILEGARTGIWTIEQEEGCPPRMYTDRTMRKLLGVSEEMDPEACYQHWFKRIEPDYVIMVQEAIREILENGRSEVIYPWNHPELGKIYVRCGGVPDRTFQKPGVAMNGYHQDITETMVTRRKQEQSIMELLERVRQANSAKSEFLSHMSHDLRTPINGILGMLAIMEKTQDDPVQQELCRKRIRVSTEHVLSLVNDVLQISKLESGRPASVEEPFDLHTLLEDCAMILAHQAEEGKLRLTLEDTGLRHRRVIGNPLHVKEILMNVMDNAIKYNRPGGRVSVRAEETGFRDGTVHCRFVVEDTGLGIGADFLPHIFESFTQEHPGARTNYGGVGLGMAIVKKLVDEMKGTVTVDSCPGEGSTVQITLPLRADELPQGAPEEDEGPLDDIAGMRVLLVEDNEMNREIMEFILRDADAQVVTACDGKDAVETFAASEPGYFDCVLMDLMMPVMSGYEAARVIRGMDRADAGSVPIIALSANAFDEDVAMAKGAGMDEHLAKPVDIRKMFQAICRLRDT